jgi:uncharacterized lipoprotein YmbA
MHSLKMIFAALVLVALTGCAATVQRTGANGAPAATSQPVVEAAASRNIVLDVTGSQAMRGAADFAAMADELRRAISAKLAVMNANLTMQAANTNATAPGTRVVITLNDFRYVSSGARYAFGVMTGNAYIDARVEIFDLVSSKKLTEQTFNTSSSAWQGIFSAMTSKQADGMADEIVALVGPRG